MFSHTMLHALTELPKLSGDMAITSFLPRDIKVDPEASRYLMYPLATGHILQPSEMKLSFSQLPAYGLLYTSKGNGTFSTEFVSYSLAAGSFLFADLSRPFTLYSEKNLEYDIICFTGAQSGYFFTELAHNSPAFFIDSLSKTGLLATLRPILPAELEYSFNAMAFHRHLTDLFTESKEAFLNEKSSRSTAKDETLSLIKEYIDNNYYKSINLKELESQFFINRFRLCKEFSGKYYVSPIQYMHVTRINKAKELLRQTSLKVHEISYQVGYESSTQFINHFKKATGHTPQDYRNHKI